MSESLEQEIDWEKLLQTARTFAGDGPPPPPRRRWRKWAAGIGITAGLLAAVWLSSFIPGNETRRDPDDMTGWWFVAMWFAAVAGLLGLVCWDERRAAKRQRKAERAAP
jgi:hypothetical protein